MQTYPKWGTLRETAWAFKNDSEERGDYTAGNMFAEGDMLYSWGHWFPLAKRLSRDPKTNKGSLFIMNGDTYSVSTSNHQRYCTRFHGPTVSAEALASAGIRFRDIEAENIVAWESADRVVVRRYKGGFYRRQIESYEAPSDGLNGAITVHGSEPWETPQQGMFMESYNASMGKSYQDEHGEYVTGSWHTLGACVITFDGRYFLCGLDEGTYFVSELPRPVKTVEQAFKALKPAPVIAAEKAGVEVLRQGEWFFVPLEWTTKEFARLFGWTQKHLNSIAEIRALPVQDRSSNKHTCRQVRLSETEIVCTGNVYHREPWDGAISGEHATVKLGRTWWHAWRNTERASWSVGGRFD